MHSSHGRSRRHVPEDDDLLPHSSSRVDERRSDPYSRSHHHSSRSEAYAATSGGSRSGGYAESTSRGHHADEWKTAESAYSSSTHDQYRDDTYSHTQNDAYYDRSDSRTAEQWPTRPPENSHYSSTSSRDWRKADEPKYVAPSYAEEMSWHVQSSYDGPRNGVDWRRDDKRHVREAEVERYDRDEGRSSLESREWRREERWEEVEPRGAEWDHSNGHKHSKSASPVKSVDVARGRADRSDRAEDRSWEPAAAWKSRERDVPSQSQRSGTQQARNNGKKSGKNNHKKQQQARRNDDSHMNNWQRREFKAPADPIDIVPASKRKVIYTRSRSRSPVPSTYSRRSSLRSRSRSVTPPPKHRRAADHGHSRKDSSASKVAGKKGVSRGGRSPVPYASSHSRVEEHRAGRPRRASYSSVSSRSRSRSSDETPEKARRKALHRLPQATSMAEIEIKAKSIKVEYSARSKEPESFGSGLKEPHTNSKSAGSNNNRRVSPPPQERTTLDTEAGAAYQPYQAPIKTSSSVIMVEAQSRAVSTGPKKNAGFKPIGQSSASVKRFFPGDDDDDAEDDEPIPRRQTYPTPPPRTVESPPPAGERNGSVYDRQTGHGFKSGGVVNADDPPTNGEVTHVILRESSVTSDRHHGASERSVPPLSPLQIHAEADRDESAVESAQQSALPTGRRDELYEIVSQVGEGTFGKVYKAQNTISGVYVALKRIRMESERDGFPVTAMREIKLLQSLRHVNVVSLFEMMVSNGSVYMVFEYMDHDLTGILSQTQFVFTDAHLKSLCQQMLAGLAYLHHKGVIHRDIKGSNILINNRGELKLGDFGLARFYQKRRRADYTNRVITLWYRPPELLLGTTVYGPEVDMWSAGCIMLELFCKKPVFQGNDEIHQLDVIYKILGTPNVAEWPGLVNMPWYELVKPKDTIRNRFRELFNKWLSAAGLDLAEQLLHYDPMQRATASQALDAGYFRDEQPLAMFPAGLASLDREWHEYESKLERAKKRRKTEHSVGAPQGPTPQ